MLTKENIIHKLREQRTYLADHYGVKNIGLFGSYAQEQSTQASDIDLLIEFDRPIGLRFVELGEYLEQLFDRPVDILTPAGMQNIHIDYIAQNIRESIIYV
ncbi:MAG TPA: nucleotidyltransferase family protein [Anaerolineae bacterium]|nr:nucleotidyltransferase family protein [Anaerolineae bacterium]HQI85579.1 nucleotidyltransferase family protein [Anaerolineae bacterium]